MRVLEVVEPGADGVFRHVEALVRALRTEGHEVALAYSSCRGSDALERLVVEVRAAKSPALDLHVCNSPSPGDLRAAISLWRLVKRWKPDVVHGHSSKAGALVRLVAGLARCAVVYTPHAYFGMGRHGPKAALYTLIERLLGGIGSVVHVSEDEARFGHERLRLRRSRCVLIPNGVDAERFVPKGAGLTRDRARAEAGLPAEGRLVGILGRLTYQKDPETAYRALGGVLKRGQVELVHVGRGELEPQCARIARDLGFADCVHRIPYLEDPAAIYRAMDVFLQTSRYEGMSLAVLEALSTNLRIVLSRGPGNANFEHEALSHAGFADVGDAEGFRKELLRVLAKPGEPNHRDVILRKYSAGRAYREIAGLYDRVRTHGADAAAQAPGEVAMERNGEWEA